MGTRLLEFVLIIDTGTLPGWALNCAGIGSRQQGRTYPLIVLDRGCECSQLLEVLPDFPEIVDHNLEL